MVERHTILAQLQTRLGYQFQRPELLASALRHSSVKCKSGMHNQRLEFLGDRVLGLLLADDLRTQYPQEREGTLAPRLAVLSSGRQCAIIARAYQLEDALEVAKNIKISSKMLGDACEALIAALYLDGGLEVARHFVRTAWASWLAPDQDVPVNPKSRLQHVSVAAGHGLPAYRVLKRGGPDHNPDFVVEVRIAGLGAAQGQAHTRKEAEIAAAQTLLGELDAKT